MKIIIILSIAYIYTFANQVFDISDEDYKLYMNNKYKMINIFKERFLLNNTKKTTKSNKKEEVVVLQYNNKKKQIKKENVVVEYKEKFKQKDEESIVVEYNNIEQKNIIEKKIFKEDNDVKIIAYKKSDILNKLHINELKKEQNMNLIYKGIEKTLHASDSSYNIDEIKNIISLIKKNKISKFESELYLKQIRQLIKGN